MQVQPTPKFAHNVTDFHKELKARVFKYFEENKKRVTGNFSLHFKAVLLWSLYIAGYFHLLFSAAPGWVKIIECLIMGGLTAAIGFNVMHDGGHGSFSRHKFVNKLAAYSVNILGASAFMWHTKHNIVHHTYTNVDGVDDDIQIPLVRTCTTQKKYSIHKYQHIYIWVLYSLLMITWLFYTDYRKYFTRRVGSVAIQKISPLTHIAFWAAKLGYAAIMIFLPIYMVGFKAWLIGFIIIILTAGFVLSIVFQLAHAVQETDFPMPDTANKINSEWALHQINTTANFATKNKLISWLVGGLNFQVEHHLFPKISHVHYPAISKIIKSTCQEFGVKYHEFAHMRNAIASHFRYIKKMGIA